MLFRVLDIERDKDFQSFGIVVFSRLYELGRLASGSEHVNELHLNPLHD